MHDHEFREKLYRETGCSISSHERDNSEIDIRHGINICASSTGNRVVIDMFAMSASSVKTDGAE